MPFPRIEAYNYNAHTTVVVPKGESSVRLCGNYKTTVNPSLKDLPPPQINLEEILSRLAGSKFFSKLDLAAAYNQMEMDAESQHILTLATPSGYCACKRLPFGIKTAPSLWQAAMERVLENLQGVQVYYDDILITESEEDHLAKLRAVLQRLCKAGLRLSKGRLSVSSFKHRWNIWGTLWMSRAGCN